MVSKHVALLCLLCVANVYAVRDASRRLTDASASSGSSSSAVGAPGGSASSSASATASTTGGTVAAFASARAVAVTKAENAFVKLVGVSISRVRAGGSAKARADLDAEAYGKAVAAAYVDAAANVASSSPNGQVCAQSVGSADSSATAFAEVIVKVLAQASNHISFANANGAAHAISVVTASAFADANAKACGQGKGSASSSEKAVAKAVAIPYAAVIAKAYAAVKKKDSTSKIVVKAASGVLEVAFADTSSSSSVDGNFSAGGGSNAGANTEQIKKRCGNRFAFCCDFGRQSCSCGSGCRAEKVNSAGSRVILEIVRGRSRRPSLGLGDRCFC